MNNPEYENFYNVHVVLVDETEYHMTAINPASMGEVEMFRQKIAEDGMFSIKVDDNITDYIMTSQIKKIRVMRVI